MHALSMVLAGGEGKRLAPLTADRAKPAVPFGGTYRLVDFVLSNLVNAGYFKIVVLIQYKSHSLDRHIAHACSELRAQVVRPLVMRHPGQHLCSSALSFAVACWRAEGALGRVVLGREIGGHGSSRGDCAALVAPGKGTQVSIPWLEGSGPKLLHTAERKITFAVPDCPGRSRRVPAHVPPMTTVQAWTRQLLTSPPCTYGSRAANCSATEASAARKTRAAPATGSPKAPPSTSSPRWWAARASCRWASRRGARRSM